MRGASKSRYRSQAGIVYDVLRTINELGRAPPTRIMYGANMPFDRTRKILETLEKRGLIKSMETEDGRRLYVLTPKGYDALNELERTKRLLEGLGLRF